MIITLLKVLVNRTGWPCTEGQIGGTQIMLHIVDLGLSKVTLIS